MMYDKELILEQLLSEVEGRFIYKDGELLYNKPAANKRMGSVAGCMDSSGYYVVRIAGKVYRLHRIIFLLHHKYLPKVVDHINGIKTDNRVENLRATDSTGNARNASKRSVPTHSRFKGVTWSSSTNKWEAQLGGKSPEYLGVFNCEISAAMAYNEAAAAKFGEFARLNVIDAAEGFKREVARKLKRGVVRCDGREYTSIIEASVDLGLSRNSSDISQACRETHRTVKGYKFRYKDDVC